MIDMERAYKKIHEKALETPSFMRSNEYIQAKLFRPDLNSLLLEMGPNCNLRCFHCGSNGSPDRKGLPNLEVITKALYGAVRSGVSSLSLTFGEPLRDENREVLNQVGKYSNIIPTIIITNGTFAKTKKSAVEWIEYLNKISFDFSKGNTTLNISMGKMYPSSLENCSNILAACKTVFPEISPGEYLLFRQIGVYEDQDRQRINGLLDSISKTFGKRRHERVKPEYNSRTIRIWAYPKKGSAIKINWVPCSPWGRAKNLDLFNKNYPVKKIAPGDLVIDAEDVTALAVFYNGDVCFSDCTSDFERNQPYGNVKKEELTTIIGRIRSDVFFQAYKLGRAALLYYAAQKIKPDFIITGRSRWDVMDAIFNDKKLVNGIRDYLIKEGVVDSYKKYISKVDMREKHFV